MHRDLTMGRILVFKSERLPWSIHSTTELLSITTTTTTGMDTTTLSTNELFPRFPLWQVQNLAYTHLFAQPLFIGGASIFHIWPRTTSSTASWCFVYSWVQISTSIWGKHLVLLNILPRENGVIVYLRFMVAILCQGFTFQTCIDPSGLVIVWGSSILVVGGGCCLFFFLSSFLWLLPLRAWMESLVADSPGCFVFYPNVNDEIMIMVHEKRRTYICFELLSRFFFCCFLASELLYLIRFYRRRGR